MGLSALGETRTGVRKLGAQRSTATRGGQGCLRARPPGRVGASHCATPRAHAPCPLAQTGTLWLTPGPDGVGHRALGEAGQPQGGRGRAGRCRGVAAPPGLAPPGPDAWGSDPGRAASPPGSPGPSAGSPMGSSGGQGCVQTPSIPSPVRVAPQPLPGSRPLRFLLLLSTGLAGVRHGAWTLPPGRLDSSSVLAVRGVGEGSGAGGALEVQPKPHCAQGREGGCGPLRPKGQDSSEAGARAGALRTGQPRDPRRVSAARR